jgi:5-methylthioadenosine/S-adenosylhomocysteine deaminase
LKRLFTNAVVLTMAEGSSGPVSGGSLAVENGLISHVGDTPQDTSSYDEVVDLGGKALLPGLVNTHGHAAMSLLRGYGDDLPLKTWLEEKMWPMEGRYGPEQGRWGAALAALEMIKGGTTCFVDMYDHMDHVAGVVEESGLRAGLCRGAIGLGPEEERDAKLREAISFAENWHGQAGGRITAMMGPHAPYTCPPEFIERFVESARDLGLPIHTHMSETEAEIQQNVDEYGVRPVEHLRRLGVFDGPALVAHAVHLTEDELQTLASHDVKVAHNPGSNLKLGSGVAPVLQMLRRGMRPSLGTDGAASNNNLDMLEEIRLAALIHKGALQDPLAVPAETALRMGTSYGAECAFLGETTGTLEAGKSADFITIDLDAAHLQPVHDVISNVVYSAFGSDVRDVYVQGEPLMRNGECLTLDEEEVTYNARRAFEAIAG